MTHPKGTIIRVSAPARINHWITGICFVLLVLSGLAMFHPFFYWLTNLFGGGQWTRAAHPWIGCVLMASYLGLIVQFWRDNLPNRDDIEWLGKVGRVMLNDEERAPEAGRFNAGQKIVFWGMTLLLPVLFFTGIVIWEVYFGAETTIETQRAAVLVHSALAIGAILLWMVHVYAAIWIRGSMRAMLHGDVTPGWAWRNHRLWLRRLVAAGSRGPTPRSNRDLGK